MTATAATMGDRIRSHLEVLYPDADLDPLVEAVCAAIGLDSDEARDAEGPRWGPDDVVLIAYADSIDGGDVAPLQALRRLLSERLDDVITTVHVLPFFPSSSDDGFAVIDYLAVEPAVGTWADICELAADLRLMADLVLNHVSGEHEWFGQFVAGETPGCEIMMTAEPTDDLGAVVRPRTSPLLRRVETAHGPRHVWCTFSHDQIDVDFSNPDVLLAYLGIIDVYLRHGVRVLRLDAVAYAWKQVGTSCIHLPEAHELVKLFRTLLAVREPAAVLVTETNVPSAENLAYLGDGDEAQAIYNFPLAPLLVEAVLTGDIGALRGWLTSLQALPEGCTTLNFLATHDGLGVRPLEGLLSPERIDALVSAALESGGQVSSYDTAAGPRPYELNVSLFDLLRLDRFVCAHTALMSLAGIPAIYVNSLFAVPAAHELVAETGRARSINRPKLSLAALEDALTDETTSAARVFTELTRRLRIRGTHGAFAPETPQRILDLGSSVLAVRRGTGSGRVVALHEMAGQPCEVSLPSDVRHDLLSGEDLPAASVPLAPYQCRWMVSGTPV